MRIREENKLAHEAAVGDELLELLKIKPSSRAGNPDKKEPDRIYRIDTKTIGLEVVTAYYSEQEAKTSAEAAAEKPLEAGEMRLGGSIGAPDESMCDAIKKRLDEKCKKTYSGADQTWLCIEADATITELATIEQCVKELAVPEHSFARVFVLARLSTSEGGVKLITVPQ